MKTESHIHHSGTLNKMHNASYIGDTKNAKL